MRIFHIAESEAWASRTHVYLPDDFEAEGFIHCSTESQLDGVAARFYHGRVGLVLLTIESEKLPSLPVYEDLYEGGEMFPHIYGAIPLAAIVEVRQFDRIRD